MPAKKTFLVSVSANYYHDHLLESAAFAADITERFSYSNIQVDSVKEFNTNDYVRRAKISTIKEVRTILALGLRDSKHIVDMAQERGEFRWSNIIVTYNGDETFCVVSQ